MYSCVCIQDHWICFKPTILKQGHRMDHEEHRMCKQQTAVLHAHRERALSVKPVVVHQQ